MGFPTLHIVVDEDTDDVSAVLVVTDRNEWTKYERLFGNIVEKSSSSYDEEARNIFNDVQSVKRNIGIPWYGDKNETIQSSEDVSQEDIDRALERLRKTVKKA